MSSRLHILFVGDAFSYGELVTAVINYLPWSWIGRTPTLDPALKHLSNQQKQNNDDTIIVIVQSPHLAFSHPTSDHVQNESLFFAQAEGETNSETFVRVAHERDLISTPIIVYCCDEQTLSEQSRNRLEAHNTILVRSLPQPNEFALLVADLVRSQNPPS
jgi:hypothetical protein